VENPDRSESSWNQSGEESISSRGKNRKNPSLFSPEDEVNIFKHSMAYRCIVCHLNERN
jgi:hypothetical protein